LKKNERYNKNVYQTTTIMNLRNGTTIIYSNNMNTIEDRIKTIQEIITTNNTSEKTIANLKYIKKIYNILDDDEFFTSYINKYEVKMINCLLTMYKKTLEVMRGVLVKTYDDKALNYTSNEKKMIVEVLYKMNSVYMNIRNWMFDLKDKSEYMKTLLKTSEENKGIYIEDRWSTNALAYYCYSHLYNTNETNVYTISSRDYDTYSYDEIYDMYYGNNKGTNIYDETLIDKDYYKWFEDENNISHYNDSVDRRNINIPLLYNYEELKARVKYHNEEAIRYSKMMG